MLPRAGHEGHWYLTNPLEKKENVNVSDILIKLMSINYEQEIILAILFLIIQSNLLDDRPKWKSSKKCENSFALHYLTTNKNKKTVCAKEQSQGNDSLFNQI